MAHKTYHLAIGGNLRYGATLQLQLGTNEIRNANAGSRREALHGRLVDYAKDI